MWDCFMATTKATMTASQIAKSLHGKKAGKRWMCRCPTALHAHGDRNRSLSVWESKIGSGSSVSRDAAETRYLLRWVYKSVTLL